MYHRLDFYDVVTGNQTYLLSECQKAVIHVLDFHDFSIVNPSTSTHVLHILNSQSLVDFMDKLPTRILYIYFSASTIENIGLHYLSQIFAVLFYRISLFRFSFDSEGFSGIELVIEDQPEFNQTMDWENQALNKVPIAILTKLTRAIPLHATRLDLKRTNLIHFFPIDLNQFFFSIPKHIQFLDLADNHLYQLNRVLVQAIAALHPELFYLDLSFNELYRLPVSLFIAVIRAFPKNLRHVILSANGLNYCNDWDLVCILGELIKNFRSPDVSANNLESLSISFLDLLYENLTPEKPDLVFILKQLLKLIYSIYSNNQLQLFVLRPIAPPLTLYKAHINTYYQQLLESPEFDKALAYLTLGLFLMDKINPCTNNEDSWESRLHSALTFFCLAMAGTHLKKSIDLIFWLMKTDASLPDSVVRRLAAYTVPPPSDELLAVDARFRKRTPRFFMTMPNEGRIFAPNEPNTKEDIETDQPLPCTPFFGWARRTKKRNGDNEKPISITDRKCKPQ